MSDVQRLAAALETADDDALIRLLQDRPDLRAGATDFLSLAARALSRLSVQRALDRLNRAQLTVVEAAVILSERDGERPGKDELTLEDLGRVLPSLSFEQLQSLVAKLRDLCLLLPGQPDASSVRVSAVVAEALGQYPAGLGRTVYRLRQVNTTAAAALQKVPPETGLDVATRVEQLREAPTEALAVLQRLADEPIARMQRADRLLRPDSARSAADDDADPLGWLLRRALLLPINAETVELPREVGIALRGGFVRSDVPLGPAPAQGKPVSAARRDNAALAAVGDVLRRLRSLALRLAREPVATLRAGGVGIREMKRLATATELSTGDAAVLLELAGIAGVVGADEVKYRAIAGKPDAAWLTEPAAEQWVALVDVWRRTERLPSWPGAGRDGTGHDSSKTGAISPGAERPAPLSAEAARPDAGVVRGYILRAILDLDAEHPSVPLTERDVVERLRWLAPRWAARAQPLVPGVLRELELLGVTGAGALTEPGRAVLAGEAESARVQLARMLPAPTNRVRIQADLSAVAPGPLSPGIERVLALCADPEGQGPATQYRFSADSIRRALDAGHSARELTEVLSELSEAALPQTLSYLIDDTARDRERVRITAASAVVVVDDPADLDLLLAQNEAQPRVRALKLTRIAPTVAASGASTMVVRDGLRELGIDAAIVSTDEVTANPVALRDLAFGAGTEALADAILPTVVSVAAEPTAEQIIAGLRTGAHDGAPTPRSAETAALIDLEVIRAAARANVTLTVVTVDAVGNERTERVVPLSVNAGRLRVYDAARDSERTISLARIVDVQVTQ